MSGRILITGSAGFIGFSLSRRLLELGYSVVGLDNMSEYYDVTLKKDRTAMLEREPSFSFHKLDLADRGELDNLFEAENLNTDDVIINLAAQAGVRYSRENPDSYIQSNLIGFFNLLECARKVQCKHLLYASSSSVYGGNTKLPFSEHDNVDHPISLYAATKKSNELLAHVYSYTYDLPTTGLRFFTVYGPWGRPDMALFIFTRAILAGEPIQVFNHGDMHRDFTYIDDIVDGVIRLIDHQPVPNPEWNGDTPDPATSFVPYRIFNIGNHQSVHLLEFIGIIEECLGCKAAIDFQPMQQGDVKATFAEISDLADEVGFRPVTSVREGIGKFIEWYKDYYNDRAQIRLDE
ncbi:NAD-dependent epimerase [bacterium]|nr:NAD-dependent epimerase [bacterium]